MFKYSIIYIFEMFYLEGTLYSFCFFHSIIIILTLFLSSNITYLYDDSLYYDTFVCKFDVRKCLYMQYAQCVTEYLIQQYLIIIL